MANVQVFQLAVDGLLVLSLLYLCLRAAKSSPAIQSSILENSLRTLVRDAEAAGGMLNEKLVQRQKRLEELLLELEQAEGRAARCVQTIQDARGDLEALSLRAQRNLQALQNELIARPAPKAAAEIETAAPAFVEEREIPARGNEIVERPIPAEPRETPQTAARGYAAYGRNAAPSRPAEKPAVRPEPKAEKPRWGGVNIYGEPIGQTPAAAPAEAAPVPKRTLAQSIEKEVHVPYSSGVRGGQDDLQRLYDAAEEMLRSGQELQKVAKATSLPLDEVRMLWQMVKDEEQRSSQSSDPRLGALSPMRRQVQTL